MNERTEAIVRIFVGLISGLILGIWKALVQVLIVVNLIITFITNKRNKEIANFCEIWNTQVYIFLRYISFVSNYRPFPFKNLEKNISKFDRKLNK
jgi:sorbitol-specific phosphotransferase system component IIC